jgi:NCS1 family nucleobase:cation symporter-1
MGTNPATSFGAGVDPRGEIAASPYFNPDLAPTSTAQRTWRLRDMAALWVAMAACVPTYMLASSLIDEGMNWWQAVLTIVLANIIVLVPTILNGHAGTKYGIPFPVYCRPAFGIRGANVPALLRALVACGWFGIQAWIGGWAIYKILEVYQPSWKGLPVHSYFAINLPQFLCFLFFWAINLFIIYRGIDSIRLLLEIKAPLLIVLGLALLAWAGKLLALAIAVTLAESTNAKLRLFRVPELVSVSLGLAFLALAIRFL